MVFFTRNMVNSYCVEIKTHAIFLFIIINKKISIHISSAGMRFSSAYLFKYSFKM